MPVRLTHDDWGRPWATPCPTNGSGDFATLALTDGFVEVAARTRRFAKGYVCAAVSLVTTRIGDLLHRAGIGPIC